MAIIRGLGWVTLTIIFVAVVIGASLGYAWVIRPLFLDADRNAIERSRQYVTSTNEELMRLILAYNDPQATEGQKQATVDTFCVTVNQISPDVWEDPVVVFEREHC